MNKVILIGRLTRDPEVRYTTGAEPMAVAKFAIAVNRIKNDEADFINCVAFNKTAELLEKYVKKGSRLGIEGRWQTGSYENKDGQRVYTNECAIDRIEFLEAKKADDGFEPIQDNGFEPVQNELPF